VPIGKQEIQRQVAEQVGLNKAQAGRAVDAVLDAIRDSLAQGEEVRLTGFGNFIVTQTSPRTVRNLRAKTSRRSRSELERALDSYLEAVQERLGNTDPNAANAMRANPELIQEFSDQLAVFTDIWAQSYPSDMQRIKQAELELDRWVHGALVASAFKPIEIPGRLRPAFRPGRSLKIAVSGKS